MTKKEKLEYKCICVTGEEIIYFFPYNAVFRSKIWKHVVNLLSIYVNHLLNENKHYICIYEYCIHLNH